jgi:hypothetical protein
VAQARVAVLLRRGLSAARSFTPFGGTAGWIHSHEHESKVRPQSWHFHWTRTKSAMKAAVTKAAPTRRMFGIFLTSVTLLEPHHPHLHFGGE